jgi:hypothetical protein
MCEDVTGQPRFQKAKTQDKNEKKTSQCRDFGTEPRLADPLPGGQGCPK